MKNIVYFTSYKDAIVSLKWINNIVEQLLLKYQINDIVEIGIELVSKEEIKKLNKLYRHIDKATDVLSFGQVENKKYIKNTPRALGDVVICYPIAVSQAKEHKHSTKAEIEFLIHHGFRHLIGLHHK